MKDTGERLIVEGNEENLSYGEHLARYLSVVDIVEGKIVLDVASGSGYGSQMMAKKAKKVIGVDYSKEAVAYAKKKYPAKNLSYLVDDATELSQIEDNSIDVVVSLETIEHLEEPEKLIEQVKRVLKTDGVFVVSTPNDDEFYEGGNPFHVHQFDFAELKRLITGNFKNFNFYYQGTSLAANLLSEQSFTKPFDQKKVTLSKTLKESTDKAMYFIAVASNYKLPELTENYVSAQRWSTRDYYTRDHDHVSTIEVQKKQLGELENELNQYKNEFIVKNYMHLKRLLAKIKRLIIRG